MYMLCVHLRLGQTLLDLERTATAAVCSGHGKMAGCSGPLRATYKLHQAVKSQPTFGIGPPASAVDRSLLRPGEGDKPLFGAATQNTLCVHPGLARG